MTAPSVVELSGEWRLGRVAQRLSDFQKDDRAEVRGWLPASVPGNIHADLMRAGLLPELYTSDHITQAGWVDWSDWWLQREVELALRPGERAFLHFDGIDYIAAIWLDDQLVALHEGAFSRRTVEITSHITADGQARPRRVAVRFLGAAAWPEPDWAWWERLLARPARAILPGKASLRPFHSRLRLLRPPMQAGWDFAPALAAIGLWEGVRMEKTGPVRVASTRVSEWQLPSPEGDAARAELYLTLDSAMESPATVRVMAHPANFEGTVAEQSFEVELLAGRNLLRFPLTIPDARMWHPWEQGAPNLYELEVTVTPTPHAATAGSSAAPGRSLLRFGIRSASWNGPRVTINGRPFFARGVNWVPCDILPGTVPMERYRSLLEMARERGVNFLRVWGGGGRERRLFYDLCDELGLVVWQEFPFACAFLDHFPRDRAFRDIARQEATAMVRELRHHPSLVVWCAGNEFSYRRNRELIESLETIVSAEDSRPLRRPSPAEDERHNWHVWHGKAPVEALSAERASFLSEFGLQAPPIRDSLERFIPREQLWPPGELWRLHHAEIEKLRHYTAREAGINLDCFIQKSQRVQARAIQLGVERIRRRKGAGAAGVAIWQWNEPWPAISWSLVDYYGAPKSAADGLRQWYHPLLLSLDYDTRRCYQAGDSFRASLWAINDLSASFEGCEAHLSLGDARLWSTRLSLPPHSADLVEDIAITLPDRDVPIRLELWQGEKLLAENHYSLCHPQPAPAPRWLSAYRTLAEWVMRW